MEAGGLICMCMCTRKKVVWRGNGNGKGWLELGKVRGSKGPMGLGLRGDDRREHNRGCYNVEWFLVDSKSLVFECRFSSN